MTVGARALWDAEQYARFKKERAQPFHDLIAGVPDLAARFIADFGCGNGELTRVLLRRWPEAEVWGLDSSEEMLAGASASSAPPNLHFLREDLRTWRPPHPLDLIVSNAVLHWVPDHARVLESLAGLLAPGGILAVQIPNNRGEASHRILDELVAEPPWAETLSHLSGGTTVEPPSFYDERLLDLGFDVRVWETIYYHRLRAPAEVLEWLKGTTLRPYLSVLSEERSSEFLQVLGGRIRSSYAAGPHGVIFPFRRLFFVAQRPTGGDSRPGPGSHP